MRFPSVLTIMIAILLAFGVSCEGEAEKAPVTPTPTSESQGEAGEWEGAEWEAEEGAEEEGENTAEEGEEAGEGPDVAEDGGAGEACPDSDSDTLCNDDDADDDNDGFSDVDERIVGSDPLDAASVPENHVINPGSCMDGLDNDGDGLIDAPDPNCPSGPRGLSANIGVSPREYAGPCPVTVELSGIVTVAAGSGTVSYRFAVESDFPHGAISPEALLLEYLRFDTPGTQTVGMTLTVSESASARAAIRINEPEERESNWAEFSVTCE